MYTCRPAKSEIFPPNYTFKNEISLKKAGKLKMYFNWFYFTVLVNCSKRNAPFSTTPFFCTWQSCNGKFPNENKWRNPRFYKFPPNGIRAVSVFLQVFIYACMLWCSEARCLISAGLRTPLLLLELHLAAIPPGCLHTV